MKIRLHKDAFFRNYNGIGYLLQQRDQRNLLLDKNGIIFFQFVNRKAQNINTICQKISKLYNEVSIETIQKDFLDFMSKMEKLKFVVIGNTEEILHIKEHTTKYIRSGINTSNFIIDKERNINTILKKHFSKYPQLLTLEIEVTSRCNLRCVHCYLGCGTSSKVPIQEMSTETICKVLKEFKDIGGIQVSFTGGEAMTNKDLPKLLNYAKKLDLSISIMTNASLLDNELLEIIKKTNVAKIQVSLYSIREKVHDSITQINGSFKNTIQSIKKLLLNKIPVQIACPVMKENINTFHEVLKWGNENNINVKVEGTIMARSDFSNDNLRHRLNLEEQETFIKNTIANNPHYQNQLLNSTSDNHDINLNDPICGAGHYMLCLEASGNYYPCPGFKLILGNCQKQTLGEIWKTSKELNKLRNLTNSAYPKCVRCSARKFCNICPGKLYNESGGDMFKLNKYFCEVAKLTKKIANDFIKNYKY